MDDGCLLCSVVEFDFLPGLDEDVVLLLELEFRPVVLILSDELAIGRGAGAGLPEGIQQSFGRTHIVHKIEVIPNEEILLVGQGKVDFRTFETSLLLASSRHGAGILIYKSTEPLIPATLLVILRTRGTSKSLLGTLRLQFASTLGLSLPIPTGHAFLDEDSGIEFTLRLLPLLAFGLPVF